MRIAIIGMGVAGISILRELYKQLNVKERNAIDIIIYTDAEQFGTGFPYQEDDESLLINQYTETMTIIPDEPDDFTDWISKNKTRQSIYHTHLPRSWFGEYLNERMNFWISKLEVQVVCQRVESIDYLSHRQYLVQTESSTEIVESVHLATGHLAYKDPYDLIGEEGYVYNPYPARKKMQLRKETSSVAIIGTGLTALDAMLFIQKEYPFSDLTFYSRNGLFSSVRGNESAVEMHYFCHDKVVALINNGQKLTLAMVKDWFFKEMDEQGINAEWVWSNLGNGSVEGMAMDLSYSETLGEFQSMIRLMRKCYPVIWKALPDDEKDLFLKLYGQQWQRFKAPIPQNTAKYLIKNINQNNISLVSGLKNINKIGEQFVLETGEEKVYTADYVINCTGQMIDLNTGLSQQDPLIQELIDKKMLTSYAYGGIAIDYPSMSIIDSEKHVHPTFKAYGQIVTGVQFGNSNVELISLSAEYGVRSMMEELKKPLTSHIDDKL